MATDPVCGMQVDERAATGEREADRRYRNRRRHHKGEAWIPGAEQVEEVQYLRGVGHL
jgi:hypothetical protein